MPPGLSCWEPQLVWHRVGLPPRPSTACRSPPSKSHLLWAMAALTGLFPKQPTLFLMPTVRHRGRSPESSSWLHCEGGARPGRRPHSPGHMIPLNSGVPLPQAANTENVAARHVVPWFETPVPSEKGGNCQPAWSLMSERASLPGFLHVATLSYTTRLRFF